MPPHRQWVTRFSSFMPGLQEIAEISEHASREWSIEKALEKMHADWQGLAFELADWKATGTYILRGGPVDEAQVSGMRPVKPVPARAARRHPSRTFCLGAQCANPRWGERLGCCFVCMSSFPSGRVQPGAAAAKLAGCQCQQTG